MGRKTALVEGETYHVFNRGAHKGEIFLDEFDKRRFQILLYLANSTEPAHVRTDQGRTLADFEGRKGTPLVDIFAYALLPNHFHVIVRQTTPMGVTQFMRKLCTGYSMYFNLKHGHGGTLFQGKFRSNHIDSDPYLHWIFAYAHLNPVSIVESSWGEKGIEQSPKAQRFLETYPFSSYCDYYTQERPERNILAFEEGRNYIEEKKDIEALLASYQRGRDLYPGYASGDKVTLVKE